MKGKVITSLFITLIILSVVGFASANILDDFFGLFKPKIQLSPGSTFTGLPEGFSPTAGYYNPFGDGVIGLWQGNEYYTSEDGLNFRKYYNPIGTLGLPISFIPDVVYAHDIGGNFLGLWDNSQASGSKYYGWNGAGKSFKINLPTIPETDNIILGYWHKFGGVGRVTLFNDRGEAYLWDSSKGTISKLDKAVLTQFGLPTLRNPQVAYYYNFNGMERVDIWYGRDLYRSSATPQGFSGDFVKVESITGISGIPKVGYWDRTENSLSGERNSVIVVWTDRGVFESADGNDFVQGVLGYELVCIDDSALLGNVVDYKDGKITMSELLGCFSSWNTAHPEPVERERMSRLVSCVNGYKNGEKTLSELLACIQEFNLEGNACTLPNYDFNCDGKINNADSQVIAQYWRSGTQITIDVVTRTSCRPLANLLTPYWRQNYHNGQISSNDATLIGSEISDCLLDCSRADLDGSGYVTINDFLIYLDNPSDVDGDGQIELGEDGDDYQVFLSCFGLSSCTLPGDVDNNGVVNCVDVGLIRDNLVGNNVVSGFNEVCADVNGDGQISINDVILLRRNNELVCDDVCIPNYDVDRNGIIGEQDSLWTRDCSLNLCHNLPKENFDFNCDGIINAFDNALMGVYLESDSCNPENPNYDVDRSGEVNAIDQKWTVDCATDICHDLPKANYDFDCDGFINAIDIQLIINQLLPSEICTDSDGGLNFGVKGTGEGLNVGGAKVGFHDSCFTETPQASGIPSVREVNNCEGENCYLWEKFCVSDDVYNFDVQCDSCSLGTCTGETGNFGTVDQINEGSEITCIGDVNDDNLVTNGDAQIIQEIEVGLRDVPNNLCCYDVDQSGDLSIRDAMFAGQIFSGLRQSPGTCDPSSDTLCPVTTCSNGCFEGACIEETQKPTWCDWPDWLVEFIGRFIEGVEVNSPLCQ